MSCALSFVQLMKPPPVFTQEHRVKQGYREMLDAVSNKVSSLSSSVKLQRVSTMQEQH